MLVYPEPIFVDLLRCPGINSQAGGLVRQPYLSYRPAGLQNAGGIDISESIPGLRKRLEIRALFLIRNMLKQSAEQRRFLRLNEPKETSARGRLARKNPVVSYIYVEIIKRRCTGPNYFWSPDLSSRESRYSRDKPFI